MIKNLFKRLNDIENSIKESKILDNRFSYFVPFGDKCSNSKILAELAKTKPLGNRTIFMVPTFKDVQGEHGRLFIGS
jgi:hypothetical protein